MWMSHQILITIKVYYHHFIDQESRASQKVVNLLRSHARTAIWVYPNVNLKPVFLTSKLYCLEYKTETHYLQIHCSFHELRSLGQALSIKFSLLETRVRNPIRFPILLLKSPHFYYETRPSWGLVLQMSSAPGNISRWDAHPRLEHSSDSTHCSEHLVGWQWALYYPSQIMGYLNFILLHILKKPIKNDPDSENFICYD